MKRVFVIHGRSGSPNDTLFLRLKSELEKLSYSVYVLDMPDTDQPKIKPRKDFIKKSVGKPDRQTYFIGHSIGCQAILRYLQDIEISTNVGGAVFIACWFDLLPQAYECNEDREIAYPWINTKIDFDKIKMHLDNVCAIFSNDDPYVSLDNKDILEKQLNVDAIIEKGKGHFTSENGVKQIQAVVDRFKKQK